MDDKKKEMNSKGHKFDSAKVHLVDSLPKTEEELSIEANFRRVERELKISLAERNKFKENIDVMHGQIRQLASLLGYELEHFDKELIEVLIDSEKKNKFGE